MPASRAANDERALLVQCEKNLPHRLGLVGKEVPAADGGNYGHRILSYDEVTEDFTVQPIRWSTGEKIGDVNTIDAFKLSYRYKDESPIPSRG